MKNLFSKTNKNPRAYLSRSGVLFFKKRINIVELKEKNKDKIKIKL